MAKIKLIVRKMSLLAIASSFLLISCNRNNEIHNDEIKTIKIAVSEGQKNYFTMLIDRFEELYSNKYKIEVKVFENNSIINYYLSHDYLDVDIVAFDNLNTANFYGEYLQTLNRFDAIGNYQSSISDYLRTSSGKINVIPGPGDLYTYCYNTDLLAKRNFKIPTTVSELTETAKRMGSYDYPCVMIDDDSRYVDSFLSLSVPLFFGTTKGNDFLNDYFYGCDSIASSDFVEIFNEIFSLYKSLYRYNFFSSDDTITSEEKIEKFFHAQSMAMFLTPNIDFKKEYARHNSTFNYEVYPLISNYDSQKWVASRPRYYLGVLNKSYVIRDQRKAIDEFFNFYSSADGQKYAIMAKDGSLKTDIVTYIKDLNIEMPKNYCEVQNAIKNGRIYITDTFESVFDKAYEILKEMAKERISQNECINKLDAQVKNISSFVEDIFEVTDSFDYDAKTINNQETIIGNYVADSIRSAVKASIVILPSGMIKGNLIKGDLKLSELNTIVNNVQCKAVRILGTGLKKLITDKLNSKDKYDYPLISGIRLYNDEKSSILGISLSNGKELTANDCVYVYLPVSYCDEYSQYILTTSSSSNSFEYLAQSIKNKNLRLTPKNLDGRYI